MAKKAPPKEVKKKSSAPKSKSGSKGSLLLKSFNIIKKSIFYFFIFSIVWVIFYRFVNPPITYLMVKRKIESIIKGKDSDIHYDFVRLKEMSPYLPLAVMASEDQKFPFHYGFDFESIGKALDKNEKAKKVRGASTITQQVAKNVFLWDGRNWVRKGFEAYFTVLIEIFWTKHRIIEVYLNVAETGINTYGVEAASYRYFDKQASRLSKDQAAILAAILPNPTKYSIKNPNFVITKRKNWILNQIINLGDKDYLKQLH